MEYCPTDKMLADFFTKPLQGKKFRAFRDQILNAQRPVVQECVGTSNLKDDGGQTIHSADKGFEKAQSGFGRRSYADVVGKICSGNLISDRNRN